ncbi:SDR family oxidoreductase [Dyella acidiphila]|uniref:SDR family oxidoreductase n=1 Tax=Dyella acidiphila TaxID=2775866 RepID=A0ABR9G9W7_9GAMM|nr:SDR family oxidoreductase [Dyella acidiphila]MBE1160844.1 SDR family oxidoreductase [Dyella acidiphila]
MNIQGKTALVTGANRGLGLAYAQALLAAGAAKVYAGARDPSSVKLAGVIPVKLDVTSDSDVAAAAAQCGDVEILINNAGISAGGVQLLDGNAYQAIDTQIDTNVLGILRTSRAFAPVLRANGGGTLVNMLSVLSWLSLPNSPTYSMSKAMAWALTNGLRNELRAQGTLVVAVHAGLIETDMASRFDGPKSKPEDIAQHVIEGLLRGDEEILADDISRQVKAGFGVSPSPYLVAQNR